MSAVARSISPGPTDQPFVSSSDFGLRTVERRMREVIGIDDAVAPVQLAVQHHLESGGARQRARLALAAAEGLKIGFGDAVALAACAELLHNAALIHDDIHDRALERRGHASVWIEYGDDIAICAGDLLISSAYATVAMVSDRSRVADLVQKAHLAVATTIDGQSKDLALKNVFVTDYGVYERVAAEKSAPLLALSLELPLVYAGYKNAAEKVRNLAEQLALAYQIADDLEDVELDSSGEGDSACLNVINVLRNSGLGKPLQIASANAYAALRKSMISAEHLPRGIGASLNPCFDAVLGKLQAAAR